jgi:rhomboid family GlyGly-CTERM serine protease
MIDALRSPAVGRRGAPPPVTGAVPAALLLTAPALLLALAPAFVSWFEYDRGAIAGGQMWRVITCHWTHWSSDHLLWDVLAFAVLVLIGWRSCPRRLLLTLGLSAATIPVAVWYLAAETIRYRGLSGIDSALFVLVAVTLLKEDLSGRRWGRVAAVALVIAGFVGKIVFELATGTTLFADSSSFVPIPLAHVVGGACGWLAAASPYRQARTKRTTNNVLTAS